MSEQHTAYNIAHPPLITVEKIEYVDDRPDVRAWLENLRRDLLRKVRQIDELLQTLDT